jgi:hypothetical protein
MGTARGAGTAYPSGEQEFPPNFSGFMVAQWISCQCIVSNPEHYFTFYPFYYVLYCPLFFELLLLNTVFGIFKTCLEHKRQLPVSPNDQQLVRSEPFGTCDNEQFMLFYL